MKNFKFLFIFLFLFAACSGCEEDPDDLPKLKVNIFGYVGGEFSPKLPTFPNASKLELKITNPQSGEELGKEIFDISEGGGQLPALDFADNIRLEVSVLDGAGAKVASGATPLFNFTPELGARDFRIQVQGVNSFAPYGSVVVDQTGGRKYAQSVFDYRQEDLSWLGRSGHKSALLSDGRVLTVGGGDPVAGGIAGGIPSFRNIYDDIQVFDPETGYFSNLDFDDETQTRLGKEKLAEPVVFPTLTAIGEDRFLVTGGLTKRAGVLRPVNSIHIIDMKLPVGERVKLLLGSDGSSLTLLRARAFHSATFRPSDQMLVVAGGIGPSSTTKALDSFELVDVANNTTMDDTYELQNGRARHEAVLLGDGTIWLMGGTDEMDVLRSTESISGTTSTKEAKMSTPRFGHAVFALEDNSGLVGVAGGYTTLSGTATDLYEVAKVGRDNFESNSNWLLPDKRGGIAAVTLHDKSILLFGGTHDSEATRDNVIRLQFKSLSSDPPFESETQGKAVNPRLGSTATLLTSGRILLIGGMSLVNNTAAALDSAEVFNPSN